MSQLFGVGQYRGNLPPIQDGVEYLHRQREFARLLSFSGWSIDDLINNPIARLDVRQWYRISRKTSQLLEIHELEKQWNPLR